MSIVDNKQGAPVLIQAAELVERLEISTSTLWRWSQQDNFPTPIKEGRGAFYDIDAVAAWVMASGKDLSTQRNPYLKC